MRVPKSPSYVTVEEYLQSEKCASVRHEYVDGQVYAMTGATRRHRVIAGNIYSALRSHLKGSRCLVDMSEAQVYVEATNSFYYPDVVVSCGESDEESMAVSNPVLIVEVLSRSSANIDKREKLFAYRKIATLKEYLIVHQRRKLLALHRKDENGQWEVFEIKHGEGELELASMPCGTLTLPFEVIYEGTKWHPDNDWMVRDEQAHYSPEEDILEW